MNRFRNITLIINIYILVIVVFFIFRLILFFTEIDRVSFPTDSIANILQAFLMGVRFDIVVSGYILLLPALVLSVMSIINKLPLVLNKALFYWVYILFTLSFAICAADIPYFNQFFSRFSIGAFEWMDNPEFVFKMILQEPVYYAILIPFIILDVLFYKILSRLFFRIPFSGQKTNVWLKIMVSLVFMALIFLGIRGRVENKSPIRIGTAYFCHNPFLNQLGLNPIFTLIRSLLDNQDETNKKIHLMDGDQAVKMVKSSLKITRQIFNSPIARSVMPDTVNQSPPNVILVIMEGMSAAKMSRHGNPNHLTPFLDSLSEKAYYFENIYTAGKHTFNGIFSSLFSFPALYRQHPLKDISKYNGLSSSLHQNGYSTIYFTTHDGQFDNVQGFLLANDFDKVISQSDYPSKEVKTTLGVPDDYLFEYAIPIIDKLESDGKPFFAAFMTASDHGPYYIPDYFKPKNTETKHQIVEYADWSLKKLVDLSSKKEWFDNTIFIFVADHGAPLTAAYDISLDYFHSPLIIYAPQIIQPTTFECIGGQIDIFPTLMGILELPFINNTLGIDLLTSERPFIFINDDDKIGVLDQEYLLIMNDNKETALYHYRDSDTKNYIEVFPAKAIEMESYAKSNLQVFQDMLLNNQVGAGIPETN